MSEPLINLTGLSTFLECAQDFFATQDDIASIWDQMEGLVDVDTMNQRISMMEATFRGNWDKWSDVPVLKESFPGEETNKNDYIVVNDASDYALEWQLETEYDVDDVVRYSGQLYVSMASHNFNYEPDKSGIEWWKPISSNPNYEGTWFFKYTSEEETYAKENWNPEFQINEEPFTQAQMDAINSNITSGLVGIMLVASAQTLSDNQQLSARTNIGAASISALTETRKVAISAYSMADIAYANSSYARCIRHVECNYKPTI